MKNFLKNIVVFLLTIEAKIILWKYKPEVIAITGSVGKTSAKDAIYTALRGVNVRKNEKSLNSEIGVPLTIIGAQSAWGSAFGWLSILAKTKLIIFFPFAYPNVLITEVGADHPGDVQKIASWLKPHTVVITGIPDMPPHGEFFSSADEVLKEKAALVSYMVAGGTLILNADDARARSLSSLGKGKKISYGIDRGDVCATDIETVIQSGKPVGVRFMVTHESDSAECELSGSVGNAHVLAALAGFAVALSRGEAISAIADRFKKHVPPPGRMRILRGVNGSTIIDDSYNSSPPAALLALDTLKSIPAERRIAVLGDMRELGRESREAHEQVGKKAAAVADVLITVGEESRVLADAAKNAGLAAEKIRSYGYNEAAKAGEDLAKELRAGDVVLAKGSQNKIRLERCVEKIMENPAQAKELLVRQEPEWTTLP